MFTYKLSLFHKHDNGLIDTTLIENCDNRDIAMERVKRLFLFQGLRLSKYKFTLKKMK
jgi:hypothetical protein